MKKFLYLLIAIIIILFVSTGYFVGKNIALKRNSSIPTPEARSITTEINEPSLTPVSSHNEVGFPMRLIISKLNVDTTVEQVGELPNGRMDVPSSDNTTAWWKYGPKPGEIGSAVIDGHLDRQNGGPAVFYNLKQLRVGDEIQIVDSLNRSYTFKVIKVTEYSDSSFPIALVFSQTDKVRLNLITCDGAWDAKNKNYDKRLVVFSELE
jgi:LPXTG-site transpeptidase (sortase) family protein